MHRATATLAFAALVICGCSSNRKLARVPPPPPPQMAQPQTPDPPLVESSAKAIPPQPPEQALMVGAAPLPPLRSATVPPKRSYIKAASIPFGALGPSRAGTGKTDTVTASMASGNGAAGGGGKSSSAGADNESDAAAAWHKNLPYGKINHPVLETMELDKPYPITVTLSGANVASTSAAPGTVTDRLQVSPRMIVELTEPDNPDGFKIDPAEALPPKLLASDGNTTWNWTVTPQHLGDLKLHIAAYVLYNDDPNNRLSYDTFDAAVKVHSITVKHESKSAWEWVQEHPAQTLEYLLPGGAGAAIIGKLIDWWRKRRRKGAAA